MMHASDSRHSCHGVHGFDRMDALLPYVETTDIVLATPCSLVRLGCGFERHVAARHLQQGRHPVVT